MTFIPYFLFPDEEVSSSAQSLVEAPGSTREGSTKGISASVAGGSLLRSVLAQKGRLWSRKGEIMPSALPQNLLPLLGRGLSVSSLSESQPLEHQSKKIPTRVKSLESALESGWPSQPPSTDSASEAPHTETHTPEPEAEIVTVSTMLDVDTDTEQPSPGKFKG